MGLLEACRSLAVGFLALFDTSPFQESTYNQQQILSTEIETISLPGKGPSFTAPSGPQDSNTNFTCDYKHLGDQWTTCSSETNRQCWLRHKNGTEYNITTDYEHLWPESNYVRKYTLTVTNSSISPDGIVNPDGKLFNGQYPGPWIQACWGDWIEVTVKNYLPCNGTTVHWHGIRQHNSVLEDGVNAVTQCPTAPYQQKVYKFRALQYGTTWYHSHYSLQYADGLAGPMTIYGPSSDNYDESLDPILITDWSHQSAFKDYGRELTGTPNRPMTNSVLVNGTGNFAGAFPEIEKYTARLKQGKKYLLRIINTSADTTFVFSIDNHELTVISSDFVPIKPYKTTHITVGIGQRYHVILHAEPIPSDKDESKDYPGWLSSKGNYWMRTIPAKGCSAFETGNKPDERQAILRYNASSEDVPVSWRSFPDPECKDEDYNKLVPILPWSISHGNLPPREKWFDIGFERFPDRPVRPDRFKFWTLGDEPMWLNFSEPTLLDVGKHLPTDTKKKGEPWYGSLAVVDLENDKPDDWIFMVITMNKTNSDFSKALYVPVAHPIHLHGHDFALVAQGKDQSDLAEGVIETKMKLDNPPRRDVALLPAGGYLIIAFKNDNPGMWLVHCHIAWHASSGLAVQLLERKNDLWAQLNELPISESLAKAKDECKAWDDWFAANSTQCLLPHHPFQDDSGI